MADTVDLTRCPHCGAPAQFVSIERVAGYAPITLDGNGSAAWEGVTEVDWNDSTTIGYLCRACDEELPDAYADELDRRLGITRERV